MNGGLTVSNKLIQIWCQKGAFELTVVEGGNRNIGRVNTSDFGDDRIDMGPTWIHGVVYPYHLKKYTMKLERRTSKTGQTGTGWNRSKTGTGTGNSLSRNPKRGKVVARVNIVASEGVQKNFEGKLIDADCSKDLAVLKAGAPAHLLRPMRIHFCSAWYSYDTKGGDDGDDSDDDDDTEGDVGGGASGAGDVGMTVDAGVGGVSVDAGAVDVTVGGGTTSADEEEDEQMEDVEGEADDATDDLDSEDTGPEVVTTCFRSEVVFLETSEQDALLLQAADQRADLRAKSIDLEERLLKYMDEHNQLALTAVGFNKEDEDEEEEEEEEEESDEEKVDYDSTDEDDDSGDDDDGAWSGSSQAEEPNATKEVDAMPVRRLLDEKLTMILDAQGIIQHFISYDKEEGEIIHCLSKELIAELFRLNPDEVILEDLTEEESTKYTSAEEELPTFVDLFGLHTEEELKRKIYEKVSGSKYLAEDIQKRKDEWAAYWEVLKKESVPLMVTPHTKVYKTKGYTSGGQILSWAYFHDLRCYVVKREKGIQHFLFPHNFKTLSGFEVNELAC
ncbi:hypothetical protein R6Q59_025028 [Mikania micrantha]